MMSSMKWAVAEIPTNGQYEHWDPDFIRHYKLEDGLPKVIPKRIWNGKFHLKEADFGPQYQFETGFSYTGIQKLAFWTDVKDILLELHSPVQRSWGEVEDSLQELAQQEGRRRGLFMGQRREEREHRKRAARMEEERIWKVDRRRRVEQMDRKRQTLTSEERQRKVKKVEEQKRQAQTLQERNRRVQKQTVTQAHATTNQHKADAVIVIDDDPMATIRFQYQSAPRMPDLVAGSKHLTAKKKNRLQQPTPPSTPQLQTTSSHILVRRLATTSDEGDKNNPIDVESFTTKAPNRRWAQPLDVIEID